MKDIFLEAAIRYAENGMKVFPLTPNSKIPLKNSKGSKEATTDIDQIKKWWTETPNANIGLTTGSFFVLDIDRHANGEDGAKSIEVLENSFEKLPVTYSVETPNNGKHLYFKKPYGVEMPQKISFLKGVDVKAHPNNYIVAPPSQIKRENGSIGQYKTINKTDMANYPEWLINFILRDEIKPHSQTAKNTDFKKSKRYKSNTTKFLEMLVKGTDVGNRNDTIAYLTGKALSYGLKPSHVYKLVEFANDNFSEPLEKKEMDRTVESIFKKELAR